MARGFERLQSKEKSVRSLKRKNSRGVVLAWREKRSPNLPRDKVHVWVIFNPRNRRERQYVVAFGSNPGLNLGRDSWGIIPTGDAYHGTKEDARQAALAYIRERGP